MSKTEKQVIVLPREHMSVLGYMRYRNYLPSPPSVCRQKNARDSIKYRQKGNDLYKMKNHDEKIHEQTWRAYTQSIALAPNNSEELACGYGNRSALLFHLGKFKECIKDCDRAISITNSDFLKLKIFTRKAECLFLLHKQTAKVVSNEALQLLATIKLDNKIEKNYKEKLNDILSTYNLMTNKKKSHHKKDKKKYLNELSNFPRSEEVPCASKAVAIQYNKKWGRHIVATEDIKPGEILALEKNYYTFICCEGMYMYCSNCTKYAWSSIPCEHCIYDIYCSEPCRAEAWKKYHQWECSIYPYIWDIDADINALPFAMRMLLIGVNEVGSIDNMKKLLIDLDKCKDPRTKGFSNGTFQSDSIRSIYSLTKHCIANDPLSEFSLVEQSCIGVELLARHTTFFGHKMNGLASKIFKNEDVAFITALMLHNYYITHNNAEHHCTLDAETGEKRQYASTVRAFMSLINHNCDPNVEVSMGKNNTVFAYALKPIKKGTQLAYSYIGHNFLDKSKEERQSYLQRVYNFKCQCLPCTENWSNICLPTVEVMCEVSPLLIEPYHEIVSNLKRTRNLRSEKDLMYSPKLMRNYIFYLESMAEKITTYSQDYENHLEIINILLHDVFGHFNFSVPSNCFST